jgi:hypothetical protein
MVTALVLSWSQNYMHSLQVFTKIALMLWSIIFEKWIGTFVIKGLIRTMAKQIQHHTYNVGGKWTSQMSMPDFSHYMLSKYRHFTIKTVRAQLFDSYPQFMSKRIMEMLCKQGFHHSVTQLWIWCRQMCVVAEWLGCRTLNQWVVGSNPGEGTAWYLWAGYLKSTARGSHNKQKLLAAPLTRQ